MASYRVVTRADTGTLWIVGPDPRGGRFRRAARSRSRKQAAAEAAVLYDEHLRESWHGPKRGSHTLDAAIVSYIKAKPRRPGDIQRLGRLSKLIGGGTLLRNIDQDTVSRIETDWKPATVQREIIVPLRAVLRHAARRNWCDVPIFDAQPVTQGRTLFLLPEEAERLIDAGAGYLRPLLTLLLGTGARLAEALELEWRDVDLEGRRVTFWRTKNGQRRVAELPSRCARALVALDGRDGIVFRRPDGEPYPDKGRDSGGQIKSPFATAVKRAGLNPALTPHCLRHTWASWHYALHKDLLRLKQDGGWRDLDMVQRYAHLMPAGQEQAIRQWHGIDTPLRVVA